jgi:alanyl aminopeptidase
LNAIGKVRDPRLRGRALALALAKKDGVDRLDGSNTLDFVYFTLEDDASRAAAFDFLRAHFEPLVAKVPEDSPVRLFGQLGRLCTPAERAAFVGFFATRAPRFVGGEIRYRQALESIDLCLAARARG